MIHNRNTTDRGNSSESPVVANRLVDATIARSESTTIANEPTDNSIAPNAVAAAAAALAGAADEHAYLIQTLLREASLTPSASYSSAATSSAAGANLKIIDIQKKTTSHQVEDPQLQEQPANRAGQKPAGQQSSAAWSPTAATSSQGASTPTATTKPGHQATSSRPTTTNQQSGETLSSFESDYDLLLYLGETETEDIVDTERSIDYQDQTWRQSICGGASLAPTIDESLSELLGAGSRQDFDLLNTPTPYHQSPSLGGHRQSYQAHTPSPSYGTTRASLTPTSGPKRPVYQQQVGAGSTQTLGRHNFQRASGPRRPEDDHGKELSTILSESQAENQQPKVGLGNKIVNLFNRKSPEQQSQADEYHFKSRTLGPDAFREQPSGHSAFSGGGPHKYTQKMVSQRNELAGGQIPPGDAAELDRLLAEMSESLDFDSLARFDMAPSTGRTTGYPPPPPQHASRPVERQYYGSSVSRLEPTMAGIKRAADRQMPRGKNEGQQRSNASIGPTYNQSSGSFSTHNKQLSSSRSAVSNDPASSILDEYDGASKILEQMISDQLAQSPAHGSKRAALPPSKQQTPSTSVPSGMSPAPRAMDLDDRMDSGRKMSSSSQATETSVVAAKPREIIARVARKISGSSEPKTISKSSSQSIEQPRTSNKPLTCQMSLDLQRVQPAETNLMRPTHSLESTGTDINSIQSSQGSSQQKPTHTRRSRIMRGLSVNRKDRSPQPPAPPAPDYDLSPSTSMVDESSGSKTRIIQVEAEISSSSGDEENDVPKTSLSTHRRNRQVDRMKRRTLSGMRSMRDRFNNFLANADPNSSVNNRARVQASNRSQVAHTLPPPASAASDSANAADLSQDSGAALGSESVSSPALPTDQQRRSRSLRRRHVDRQSEASEQLSLGQQIRERLSRSKNRLTKFLGANKRAKSAPSKATTNSAASSDIGESNGRLFQPSDIARNSPPSGRVQIYPIKIERGDSFDRSLDRHLAASLSPKPAKPQSSSSSSSSLSGLDTSGNAKRPHRPGRADSRNSGPKSKSKEQSSSLLSIKRLGFRSGEPVGARNAATLNAAEDLDSLRVQTGDKSASDKEAKRRRHRGKGSKSPPSGGSSPTSGQPHRSKTSAARSVSGDEYFGRSLKLPEPRPTDGSRAGNLDKLAADEREKGTSQEPFERGTSISRSARSLNLATKLNLSNKNTPKRTQSLRQVQAPKVERRVTDGLSGPTGSASNWRLLEPTNSFRPVSALAQLDSDQLRVADNDITDDDPSRDAKVVTPIGPRHSPLAGEIRPQSTKPAQSPNLTVTDHPQGSARAVSPLRARGSAIMHDIKQFFGSPGVRRKTDIPSRPPRSRRRAKSSGPSGGLSAHGAESDPDDGNELEVIETEPASPPGSTLERLDKGDLPHRSTSKKLANFAQNIRETAADLFHPNQESQRQGRQRKRGPPPAAPSQSHQKERPVPSTSKSAPDEEKAAEGAELRHWSPVIKTTKPKPLVVLPGTSIGFGKGGQPTAVEDEHARPIALNRTGSTGRQQRSVDSDSTWESASEDEANILPDLNELNRTNVREARDESSSPAAHSGRHSGDKNNVVDPTCSTSLQVKGEAKQPKGNRLLQALQVAELNYSTTSSSHKPTVRLTHELPPQSGELADVESAATLLSSSTKRATTSGSADELRLMDEAASAARTKTKTESEHRQAPPPPPVSVTSEEPQTTNGMICKNSAFEFHANLPSPAQVSSKRKIDDTGSATGEAKDDTREKLAHNNRQPVDRRTPAQMATKLVTTRLPASTVAVGMVSTIDQHRVAHQLGARATSKQTEGENEHRLSIYENVDMPTSAIEDSDRAAKRQLLSKDQTQENSTTKISSKNNIPPAPKVPEKPARLSAVGGVQNFFEEQQVSPQDSPTTTLARNRDWQPEAEAGVTQISVSVKEKLRRFDEQLAAVQQEEAEQERLSQLRGSSVHPNASFTKPEPAPKPKLVAMTSIIQEPNDELMMVASAAHVKPASDERQSSSTVTDKPLSRTFGPRRYSGLSIASNNFDDNSDEDSSYANATANRKLLVSKFEQQRLQQRSAQAQEQPAKPKSLPFGGGKSAQTRGRPSGDSMVKRLARNFDTAGTSNAPVTGKPPRPPGKNQIFPSVVSTALSVDEDQKSESTWYDAKSIELLDEAEVAELLREFDEPTNERPTSSPNENRSLRIESMASGDCSSISTGADPYVTVADSTLAEHQGRASTNQDGDAEDTEDTLNDGDDDDLDDAASIPEEEDRTESYVSAATSAAQEPSQWPRPQASEKGKGKDSLTQQAAALKIAEQTAACNSPENYDESTTTTTAIILSPAIIASYPVTTNKDRNDIIASRNLKQDTTCVPEQQPPEPREKHQLLPPNIDAEFKNSLNNIIARRSSQPTIGGDQGQMRGGMQTQQVEGEQPAPKRCLSTRKLRGLTSYCHALLRHGHRGHKNRTPALGEEASEELGTADKLRSSCSSSSSSVSSSTVSSSCPSEAESDDEDGAGSSRARKLVAQADSRKLLRAAKKCSRLYEELEKILAHRAEQQHAGKDTPTSEGGTKDKTKERPDGEEEEEDYDDFGESLSAITEREDQISLSSSSLSSESIPEIRQRQNLQKLYYVVNEIYSSEAKFVDTLRLLNVDFRKHMLANVPATATAPSNSEGNPSNQQQQKSQQQAAAVNHECVSAMLKHLPQLQALNESLLAELKLARDQWPREQKIAHVLVKIGPFLKHYSTYIREFEFMQQQFQENLKRYPHFAEQVRQFEQSDRAQKLTIQHHLLRPIQRIPQYRLLLQQYLHHLKPDDVDYEDTVSALEVVSRVAEHANQSMSEGANFAKLLALQAKIVGKRRDIVQPGRLFVKEGELLKICRKQVQARWFVLLSDALLYLTPIQSSDILYLNNELPLDDCLVSTPEESEQTSQLIGEQQAETGFTICSRMRSFALVAKSRTERDEWVRVLRKTIDELLARRRSFSIRQARELEESIRHQQEKGEVISEQVQVMNQQLSLAHQQQEQLLGRKAPLWTPDSRVTMCQLCTSSFSALFRRHHCRACGRVVCSACSSNRAPLIYLKCRAARVCDECFDELRASIHLYYLPPPTVSGRRGEESSQELGEQELGKLDEHFRTLLKSQFVRHVGFKLTRNFKKLY